MESILLCTFVASVSCGKYMFSPSCPEVIPKEDFDINGMLGIWYEESHIERGKWWYPGGKCHTVQFLWKKGTRKTDLIVYMRQLIRWVNTPIVRSASVEMDDAVLHFTFNDTLGPLTYRYIVPYWVIDTDYYSWAFIWSCIEKTFSINANAYILTRSREKLDPASEEKLQAVLTANKLSREMFTEQSQDDCERYQDLILNTIINV